MYDDFIIGHHIFWFAQKNTLIQSGLDCVANKSILIMSPTAGVIFTSCVLVFVVVLRYLCCQVVCHVSIHLRCDRAVGAIASIYVSRARSVRMAFPRGSTCVQCRS